MNNNKITGIYMIKCTQSKKFRIGGATDIMKRFSNYKSRLSNGLGNERMVEDVLNYGLDSFEFLILQECSIEDLFKMESKYMDLYSDCLKDGYNSNRVVKREKYIRNLEEQRAYKETRSKITSGELNGHCRLKESDVKEMLYKVYIDGISRKEVCLEYGVSDGYISRIGCDRWVSTYKNFIEKHNLEVAK